MSFLLPNPLSSAAAATLPDACVASTVGYYDQTPVPTVVRIADDRLTLTRTQMPQISQLHPPSAKNTNAQGNCCNIQARSTIA